MFCSRHLKTEKDPVPKTLFSSYLKLTMMDEVIKLSDSDRNLKKKNQTPWPEFTGEIYRPSDHRLSAKLVVNFCG
jgi:hypothetical protein